MRRLLVASTLAVLVAAVVSPSARRVRAQAGGPAPQQRIPSLAEPGEGLTIRRTSGESGRAAFAVAEGQGILLPGSAADTAADRASVFVDLYGQAFGLRNRTDVRLSRAPKRDALGLEHVRFQQIHQGIPVTGAEFLVHLRGNRAVSANGRVLDRMPDDLTPAVSAAAAQAAARDYIATEKAALAQSASYSEPRLEIFNRGFIEHTPGAPSHLAWFVEATDVNLREFIWLDAQTGAVLLAFSQIQTARVREVYTANGTATLPGTLARSEGDPPTGDNNVDSVYNLSNFAYNYFFNSHARDSYDGAGGTIRSTVNWNGGGSTCPNAFWNGTRLVSCNNAFGRDITGHEFTHAVIQYEANFFNWGLSGALSESFADIFGETMDLLPGTDPPADRWKIGEITIFGVIRNMMTPSDFALPGHMSQFPFGGGIVMHSVPSHAYALMVDGGMYNNRTITGIGLIKAAQIQYRALTTYLTTSSDFLDDFQAVNQSCSDLLGTSGITASDCAQVNEAMLAVEMNSTAAGEPGGIVPVCPAGGTPTYLLREGFETGAPGWTVSPASPARWGLQSQFADVGAVSALGQIPGVASDHSYISPSFVVPAGGRMMFRHTYEFSAVQGPPEAPGWVDGGVVEYTTDGGTTWKDMIGYQPLPPPAPPGVNLFDRGRGYNGMLSALSPLGSSVDRPRQAFVVMPDGVGFAPTRLNLAPIAGQTVRFRWRIGTFSPTVTKGWYLDQVDIYSCTTTAGAPAITVQPLGQFAPIGTSRTLTVTATGTPTLRYQWLKNGFPVQGATASSLAFASVTASDYGSYNVMISNDIGTVMSDSAILFGALGTPFIVTQPLGRTITVGQTTAFFAQGDTDFSASYQWQLSTNGGATWNPVPDAAPYSGGTTKTLTITAATLALNNTLYRMTFTVAGFGTATSRAARLGVIPADLIANGTFATGDTTGWSYFDNPAGSGQRQVTAGVFEWNRPGNSATQSTLFQNTGAALSGPIQAQFDIGNSANIRQRVSVLLIEFDFSDITVCTFWLEPAAPLRTYRMRTHTSKAWTNAAVYFYAATTANVATNGGYLRLDNVSVGMNSMGSVLNTECEDPTAPAPPGGPDSASLLTNGDFSAGMTGWSTFGVINSQVSSGVFEYIRPSPGPALPAGVVFQATGQAVAANEFLTATFDLGNSSALRKRVTVLILSNDFTDLAACTFWLPPGMPMAPYQMKTRATKAWAAGAATGAALYFYAATVGSDRWIRVDNAVLKRTPGAAIVGTECLEPVNVVPPPAFAPSAAAAPGFDEAAVSQVHSLPGGDGSRILPWPRAIDLDGVGDARLKFFSSASGFTNGSGLEVQVSLDGVTWETVAEVPPGEAWTEVDIDLSPYAGRTIYLQFVRRSDGDETAVWQVGRVRLVRRN
jgi:Zn-dependent metalloprotease